jgi:hypothetical protein
MMLREPIIREEEPIWYCYKCDDTEPCYTGGSPNKPTCGCLYPATCNLKAFWSDKLIYEDWRKEYLEVNKSKDLS